ncbi:hypothetical protein GCM10009798_01040 [Nocardioides panacihumi]|uniref:PqqD family protein n=1 Tax=Nocardioides panacihumi TaxID=400774 RepID=A0ABN2Q6T2_9ACTN
MPDAPLRHRAELAFTESADRVAVLDLDRPGEPAIVLTGPGSAIWAAVDGRRGIAEIVAVVASSYDVAESDVDADVRAFLQDLVARGLLVG